ncbi:hypothetical protein L210DRAFT_3651129 [Boletus edulis BED1]|uniref:Uncharacterized protein n=1 Tax=Boletus edulis BED1 TaxID=1328754 RepID=A0AAD4BIY7_BOLED|nr:hypothetical protein L210DRAFT_3651129 [Boletus edulis BED1]
MVEDFAAALDAVSDDDDDLYDDADGDNGIVDPDSASHGANVGGFAVDVMRELDEMRRVMVVPAPDANAAELRKALGDAQLAYTRIRQDLNTLRTEHNKLQAQLAPRTRTRALKMAAAGPLDTSITNMAKKYALLYHLWVPSGIFPLRTFPANFNFNDPRRFQSSEARTAAYGAEIYLMLPVTLQKPATKYEQFEHLFTSTVNTERANILKPLKDSVVQLFTHLSPALDPAALGDWRKRTGNHAFLSLLKRNPQNPDDPYTPLAPILFQDPKNMDVQGLFKNKTLTQMACVLFNGKGILTGKKRGGPPGRGKKLGATTTSDGMIAACCTITRYLLSGDEEFSSTGNHTGIPYEKDFEYYVEMLQKPANREWALGVTNHFNDAVFGMGRKVQQQPDEAIAEIEDPAEVQSWENDIMAQLGGFGGDRGANPPIVNPSSSAADLPPFDRPAQLSTNLNLPDHSIIAMNPPSLTGVARAPVPSISGHTGIPTHAPIPVAFGSAQNASAPVMHATNESITLDIQVPLANLSLAPQPGPSGPVVVPALVGVPSSKPPRSKKGKKSDQPQAAEEATGVPVRATRARAKRS